ncbi:hypothetical protein H6775_03160 [Candidatus Nomurabacteria bacterium]|nr:hypothetical protein [Candidatus Nomurabacteria bacterium]
MDNENLPQPNEPVVGSKTIITIVPFILITALVVGGAVYAWQKTSLNKTEQSLQTEITTLQNQIKELQDAMKQEQSVATREEEDKKQTSPVSVTPGNWKTYSDEEFGYSVDYPCDWEVTGYKEGEVYISYPGWRQMPEGGGSVVISVEDKTLEQFLEEYKDNPSYYGGSIVSQESYTLNGISSNKLVMTTAIGLDQSFIFISRANKSYIISFQDYDDSHLGIIKTFRFID